MVFLIFGCLFVKKIKNKVKFLLASMKSIAHCEHPSSNHLHELLLVFLRLFKLFRNPPVILNIVPKAGHECILEKINQWERSKAGTKTWCRFGTIVRISKFFQRSKQKLCIFSTTRKAKNLKSICICKSNDLIIQAF